MRTEDLLQAIQDVAERIILPRWRSLGDGEVMEKNPGDLVTVADQEAEVELTRLLTAAYPDALVVGEEATAVDPTARQRLPRAPHAFTVDPVDGTKNFVHGSPDFGVMVAELRDGEPVRSIIWQPVHGRAYLAERGAGAWRDGERLTTRAAADDEQVWRLATSRWSLRGRRLDGLPPLVGSWVSCAVDIPHLLDGDADALYYGASQPWDIAPGALLVREAGGALSVPGGAGYSVGHVDGGVLMVGDPTIMPRLRTAFDAARTP